MEFVPILVMAATVAKIVDFARYARDRDVNAVITQALAWVAGFGVVALAAHTPWAAGLVFADVPLARIGVAGQVLVGLALGSAASAGFADLRKAADNTQSAAVPPLLPPRPARRRAAGG